MAELTKQVSVGTAATLIHTVEADGNNVTVFNNGSGDVHLGFTNAVSASTGFILKPGAAERLRMSGASSLYGIAAVAQTVHVLVYG